jgi:DMSO/TMAO reductase YedYZ heme-binding membrane subunit
MKRLGKTWKRLHQWVYLAALLAVVHFVWLVKSDIREPLLYGAVVIVLLLVRVPGVRKATSNLGNRLITRRRSHGVARPNREPF